MSLERLQKTLVYLTGIKLLGTRHSTCDSNDNGWLRPLWILWFAMLITMVGFGSVFPFLPLYLIELGITDSGKAALWSGVLGGVPALLMMLTAPLWGILGNRTGSKRNVIIGLLGFSLVYIAASSVPNFQTLLLVWPLLGMLPAPAMVAIPLITGLVPQRKITFSIGVLTSATFLGFAMGPFLGGTLIDQFGFRFVLLFTSVLLCLSGLTVLLFVKNDRQKHTDSTPLVLSSVYKDMLRPIRMGYLPIIFGLLFIIQSMSAFTMPVIPLLTAKLSLSIDAGLSAGIAFSIMGITGGITSMFTSKIIELISSRNLILILLITASLVNIPVLFIGDLIPFYIILGIIGACEGGLVTLIFAQIGLSSDSNRSAIYGASQSISALAWALAPIIGGLAAGLWGLREVFILQAVICILGGFTAIILKYKFPETKIIPEVNDRQEILPDPITTGTS